MLQRARSGAGARGLALFLGVALVIAASSSASAAPTPVPAASSPMSKKAFIKVADDICRQANILLSDLVGKVVATLGNQQPTTAQLQSYIQQADPIFRQQLSSIRALVPPRADRTKVKKLLDTLEREITAVEAHPEQLVSTSTALFAKSAKLAHSYGFKVCGTSNF